MPDVADGLLIRGTENNQQIAWSRLEAFYSLLGAKTFENTTYTLGIEERPMDNRACTTRSSDQ